MELDKAIARLDPEPIKLNNLMSVLVPQVMETQHMDYVSKSWPLITNIKIRVYHCVEVLTKCW